MNLHTEKSCAWCGRLNPVGGSAGPRPICPDCQHRADLPRLHCDCGQAGCLTPYAPQLAVGERVIFQHPSAALDGLRGVIEGAKPGGYYDVRLDDGRLWDGVWESKLEREADYPDYPLPENL